MDKVQIEWGDLDRTEAIEQEVFEKAEKILNYSPNATNLVVHFKIVNPKTSAGRSIQSVSMEVRLPGHQDVRSQKEGDDLYRSIKEAQKAVLIQLESKQNRN